MHVFSLCAYRKYPSDNAAPWKVLKKTAKSMESEEEQIPSYHLK